MAEEARRSAGRLPPAWRRAFADAAREGRDGQVVIAPYRGDGRDEVLADLFSEGFRVFGYWDIDMTNVGKWLVWWGGGDPVGGSIGQEMKPELGGT